MKTMGAYKSTLLYTSTRRQTTYIRIDNTHTLVQTASVFEHLYKRRPFSESGLSTALDIKCTLCYIL